MNRHSMTRGWPGQRPARRRPQSRLHRRVQDQSRRVRSLLLGLAVGAAVFLAVLGAGAAQAAAPYVPPTLTHWCVSATTNADGSQTYRPGVLDMAQQPYSADDASWVPRRYRTWDNQRNPGARRGAPGFHAPAYRTALLDLGYDATDVEVMDAHCTIDEALLSSAVAVRISGTSDTPFEPGAWFWGKAGWDTGQWVSSVTEPIPRRALDLSMGKAAAELYVAVVLYQVQLAELACDKGAGPAVDAAAGDWKRNKAGKCRSAARTRPGDLLPEWARPVRIQGPGVELPGVVGAPWNGVETAPFRPGRLSSGFVDTDLVRP